jgi:signal transduction histidine kinase
MRYPSNGKVAHLSHELRNKINRLVRDGFTYKKILAELGEPVKHISPRNLSNWRKIGYQRWLEEEARIERIGGMADLALRIAKENEGTVIHWAGLQTAAAQILELLSDFDAKSLKATLDGDTQNYARLTHVLARLSEAALKYDRYRAEIAEKKEKLQQMLREAKEGGMAPESIANLEDALNLM